MYGLSYTFALAILISASFAAPPIDKRTTQEPISVGFEDPRFVQGTIVDDYAGLHFDGFAAVLESPVGQLVDFKGVKAAIPAPSGNEVRTDVSTTKYRSLNLRSVAVGCFLNRQLAGIINGIPLGSLGLDDLAAALAGLGGTGATAAECTIRVRLLGTEMASPLASLQRNGKDFKDCSFKPTLLPNLPGLPGLPDIGQGTGELATCDLSGLGWDGVTRFNVTIQKISTISLGQGQTIGGVLPVFDDLKAVGNLK